MIKSDGLMSRLVHSWAIKTSHSLPKLLKGVPLRFSGQVVSREARKLQAEGCGGPGPALSSLEFCSRPPARDVNPLSLRWGVLAN